MELFVLMKKILLTLTAVFLAFSLVSCSSKGKGSGADGENGTSLSESDLNNSRFGEGNIPRAEEDGMFRNIYFDYDSSKLNDRGRQDVEFNAEVLKQNSGLKITLEGHCDSRGTKEYNMALGSRRSQAVLEALQSFGISRSQLSVISYGSEIPLDQSEGELAFAKNRRVHFAASMAKGKTSEY